MLKKYHSYLRDIGLSEIQIQLYDYIIEYKFGTVQDIKEKLNYSYSQVNYNLSILEEMGLVFSSKGKNKKFYRIDPKIALSRVLDEHYKKNKERIYKLEEHVKAEESDRGKCFRHSTFYHYSDENLAYENFYKLIDNSTNEIFLSSLPPLFLDRIEPALYNAYLRGVNIELYFSNNDFDEISNYFDLITGILKRIRLSIVQTSEKTCQIVRYNDMLVNDGLILIDDVYFNSILFLDNDIFHFDGFTSSQFVETAKKFLKVKSIIKRVKMEFQDTLKQVIDIIRENNAINTREIGIKSKIGGAKLREILDVLLVEGIIEEKVIKNEKGGKPRKEYSLSL